jgi:pimeloyl-ACP methyl ester carboxylesterase
LWVAVGCLLLVSCATVPSQVLPGLPHSDRPAVFVVDGAGDYRACSRVIRQTAANDGLSLEVLTFVWSHGYLRNIVDQTDFEYTRERGTQLAQAVQEHKSRHPNAPITLVGHSAGTAVVLAAAETLPPGTVDHIVLLAPSLSQEYDLRPALRSANEGIDAFISENDWIWLGLLVRVLGTTDNPLAPRAAGQFGFAEPPRDSADALLYAKLHVHRWTPEDTSIGHNGGHFGAYQPAYLRARVFPVICR